MVEALSGTEDHPVNSGPVPSVLAQQNNQYRYEDQRTQQNTQYVDQRSVHLYQQNVQTIDPLLVEAQQAVHNTQREAAAVVIEAQQAVHNSQREAAVVATQLEATQAMANQEVSNLRQQLELMRLENLELKSKILESNTGSSSHNETALIHEALKNLDSMVKDIREANIVPRVQQSEQRLHQLETQLNHHQALIQELWDSRTQIMPSQVVPQQVPASQVMPQQVPAYSPIVSQPVVAVPKLQEYQSPPPKAIPLLAPGGGPPSPPSSPVHFNLFDDDEPEGNHEEDQEEEEWEDLAIGLEKKYVRTKDLHHLKLPGIPDSAATFRTWRNAVRTAVMAYDHSSAGVLGPWLSKAFTAQGNEAIRLGEDSEGFPMVDRVLASLMCRPEVLRSSFGIKVQAYIEACEAEGLQCRGRLLLNMIAREYDTSTVCVIGMKRLSQLTMAQRPAEAMLSHWAYQSLKKHPHMRRVIDRYKDDVANQTFEYLFNGVSRTIRESQHDANAQSIRDDLRKGPKHSKQDSKDNKTSAAAASPKGTGKEKKGGKSQPSNPGGKGQSQGSKEAAKAKGKQPPPKGKSSAPKPGENPPVCIFHARGKCTRANCPFLHMTPAQPASSSTVPPAKSVPTPKAKVAAMVACLSGLGPVMGLTTTVDQSSVGYLDFIGDTGAGECLGSPEALKRQGVSLPDHFFAETSNPLKFSTGGGVQSGTSTVGCWSDEFSKMLSLYMLPQCPLALSIGQLCNDGFSFVWPAYGIPFLVPSSSSLSYQVDGSFLEADRVDHNVPVFRISTDFVPGLPCAPSGGEYAAAMPSEDSKDAKEPGESGEVAPESGDVAPEEAVPEGSGDRGEDDDELEDVAVSV
eukprot:Skav232719  [mRNA]  locus=scaffold4051:118337:123012:+ [translate_table: standard]